MQRKQIFLAAASLAVASCIQKQIANKKYLHTHKKVVSWNYTILTYTDIAFNFCPSVPLNPPHAGPLNPPF